MGKIISILAGFLFICGVLFLIYNAFFGAQVSFLVGADSKGVVTGNGISIDNNDSAGASGGTSSGGSGKEGSGSGAVSSGNADDTGSSVGAGCVQEQISYSLQDFFSKSTCVEESDGVCIRKEVDCAVDVHNLDYNTGGVFEIYFKAIDDGGNVLASDSLSKEIVSRELSHFDKNFLIQGTFLGKEVNGELKCDIGTNKVPSVCS